MHPWTIDRLTLNLGLRWETFNSTIKETPATLRRFTNWDTPFAEQRNVPKWTDWAPRLGMAYDLFGDASTALKLSWGRYNASNIFNYARDFHPGGWQNHERDWFDCALSPTTLNTCASMAELDAISPGLGAVAYGTRDPNVTYEKGVAGYTGHQQHGGTNGDDYVQDWEVGVTKDPEFGGPIGRPRQDPDGVARPWASLFNAGIQRELMPGLSASFNWYRRDSFDGILQRNANRSLNDYVPFQISNPCGPQSLEGNALGMAPSGFPCSTSGVSAQPTLTVYSLTPEAQLRTPDHVVINTYGDDGYSDQYNGFETSFNARLPNGTNIFGGWTMERNLLTRCDTRDDPNELLFCDPTGAYGADSYGGYDVPWLNEFKLSGTLPLPGGLTFSGSLQSYNPRELHVGGGTGQSAGGLNGGGELEGSLTRTGNVRWQVPKNDMYYPEGVPRTNTITIPLMAPGSAFLDRLNQVDISIRKVFDLANGMRFDVQADIYNIINSGPIIEGTNFFGGSMGNVTRTVQGRFLQLATNIHW